MTTSLKSRDNWTARAPNVFILLVEEESVRISDRQIRSNSIFF
jgi:hypothetical protein